MDRLSHIPQEKAAKEPLEDLRRRALASLKLRARDKDKLVWLLTAAGLFILPLILGDGYYLTVLNFIAFYSMVALGLCLLLGYGGQLSISHAAFYAIGAYTSSIFCLRYGLHPLVSIVLSQCITTLTAWGIGAVVLRLKGHYLAIATLSFSIIVEVLIREIAWLTGGLQGLSSIPAISLGGFFIDSDWRFYFLVWSVTMLLLLFALNLVNSRMGRIFRAIREAEDIAGLFGADVKKYKVKLFIVASIYASLAGSLYAHYATFISPDAASIMFAIEIILVISIGGYTMLWGAMVGVAAITYLNEYLADFAEFKRTIYGLALVVIMLAFPNGLLQGLKDSAKVLFQSVRKGAQR
ncbi:MAG: branched-chain amino acid ABC transporter permease [Proteobacteria bacterium]|nr:branched-chain amino acid ABC transporter permease [Pseudomonadota bacterium]